MAGWTAAYDAAVAKYTTAVHPDEAVTIAVLITNPLPKGDRVAVVTVSGGAGIWGADVVSAQGLHVPELSGRCAGDNPRPDLSYGSPRNPVDITAQAVHSGGLQKTIDLLASSDEIDAILVVISMSSETRMPFKLPELAPLISGQKKPIVFWSYTLPSNFARTKLAEAGVVILSGLTHRPAVAPRNCTASSSCWRCTPHRRTELRDYPFHLDVRNSCWNTTSKSYACRWRRRSRMKFWWKNRISALRLR